MCAIDFTERVSERDIVDRNVTGRIVRTKRDTDFVNPRFLPEFIDIDCTIGIFIQIREQGRNVAPYEDEVTEGEKERSSFSHLFQVMC